jgi:hypothetical protein
MWLFNVENSCDIYSIYARLFEAQPNKYKKHIKISPITGSINVLNALIKKGVVLYERAG